jgi:hypothetical protein
MSKRPGRIKAVHKIDLGCDRTDPVSARNAPKFGEYVTTIWQQLEIQTSTLDMHGLRSMRLADELSA